MEFEGKLAHGPVHRGTRGTSAQAVLTHVAAPENYATLRRIIETARLDEISMQSCICMTCYQYKRNSDRHPQTFK